MLQDIRENAQGTIAKIIIAVLILSLSIWGMDAIVGGFSGEPEVATVNGQDIPERDFLRLVQMETQRRLSQMESPDPALLNEDQIRKDVLETMIQQEVMTQDAESQGLALTDADVDALIRQMPQFQVNGQYNTERYKAVLRNAGMGPGEFRQSLHKQYVINQIRAGIIESGVVTSNNVARLLRMQNQTRDFRVVNIPVSAIADQVKVTDNDIQAYYDANKSTFQQPEQVDAAYITLSLGALADQIEISDKDLEDYYKTRAESLAREERRASHILIEDGEDADKTIATIQKRLADGESFADLAKEYSIDTASAKNGGDLGYAGRGVYDDAFEQALFALKKGQVSDPVKTRYGVHLIKLDDVRRSEVPPLDEIKDKLRDELARDRAEKRYAEVRSQLADSAYAADDLAEPAKELGLEVREAKGITRNGGPAPFDHQGLVRQLYSDDVLTGGYNTELIDVGDNVSVVARVRKHHDAEQLSLDQVRDDIRDTLTAQKTQEALQKRADSIIAGLREGQTLGDLNAGEWVSYKKQPRTSPGLDTRVMQAVFSLKRPEESKARYGKAVNGNRAAVVALDAVNEEAVDKDGTEFGQLNQFLESLEGQREYAAYQKFLRDKAEVERP
jgi:peptidyl-prolyl cis-trans isomerase D